MASKAKNRKRGEEIVSPTPEQLRAGGFQIQDITDKSRGAVSIRIGKAYRRKPMIDTLLAQNLITQEEHRALRHYRHHADIADRSPVRDSLCIHRAGGSGNGPTVTLLNAVRVQGDCERAAGSLRDILRAVVIYDTSPSQWAIERAGAVEQHRQRGRKKVCTIEPKRTALRIAQLEIKIAAGRVMAELAA